MGERAWDEGVVRNCIDGVAGKSVDVKTLDVDVGLPLAPWSLGPGSGRQRRSVDSLQGDVG